MVEAVASVVFVELSASVGSKYVFCFVAFGHGLSWVASSANSRLPWSKEKYLVRLTLGIFKSKS